MQRVLRPEEFDIPMEESAAFTGHRPEKLPWGWDEEDPRCVLFKERLTREIDRAYEKGARYFLCGMAEGFDLYAAEAVKKLAKTRPDMKLIAVFPYGTGGSESKRSAAAGAFRVVSMHESYISSCYGERNRFLVEHSFMLICGFSGDMKSGTGSTLRMAMRKGREVVVITTDGPGINK